MKPDDPENPVRTVAIFRHIEIVRPDRPLSPDSTSLKIGLEFSAPVGRYFVAFMTPNQL